MAACKMTKIVETAAKSTCSLGSQLCFELSSDQKLLRESVRQFVVDDIIPVAAEYDSTMAFPWPILKKAHALGFLNSDIPATYGGPNHGCVSSALILQEISYGCTGVAIAAMCTALAQKPLVIAGSDELKRRFFSRMVDEPLVAAYAVTEPNAGSDVSGAKTKCEKKGDEYVINGSKMWITNAGHANWFFVLARDDPSGKLPPGKAFTAFVVEGDSAGITLERKEINMGQRCSDTRGVIFEDVRVPASNVIGARGEGFKIAMKTFDRTRPLVAAMSVGLSARCLDESTRHSIQMKESGSNSDVIEQRTYEPMLSEMAMNLELSRMITYRSAHEMDITGGGSYYSSLAKMFGSQTANRAASCYVQIMGAAGCSSDNPAEKLFRDAKILEIYGGTSQIQQVVIARELMNRFKKNGCRL